MSYNLQVVDIFMFFIVGEASGKPSVPIMKNVESEVNRARGEMSELQKVI